uniref:Uncharacterized protein n=1 Tax=Phaffia rhodozyma TaxID=264483 RepID=Q9HFD6_PHARH|nr:hypothetical protein [Phaffia rhodozyma]
MKGEVKTRIGVVPLLLTLVRPPGHCSLFSASAHASLRSQGSTSALRTALC